MDELIELIHQNNSNEKCKASLTADTIDLEGYSFPDGSGGTSSKPQASAPPVARPAVNGLMIGEKYPATLEKCTDGDTAHFNLNGTVYKTRFLYIDTPESTNRTEPFGKEASEYTCSFLKQGTITLETDGKDLFDRYDRLLAWVWVDDKLHQEEITKAGFVKGFYDYGDYKYEDLVVAAMDDAKSNFRGIYEADKPIGETGAPPLEEKDEEAPPASKETRKEPDQHEKAQDETAPKDEQSVASEPASVTDGELEVSDGAVITGIILAALFFSLPRIKSKLGANCVIAHRLRAKKWWLNVILFLLLAAFWWIPLLLNVVELIHLIISRKAVAL